MKKMATIIAAGALVVALVGCAPEESNSSSSSLTDEPSSVEIVEFIDEESNDPAIEALTGTESYKGLQFAVNPEWKSETSNGMLKLTVSSSAVITAKVVDNNISLGVDIVAQDERDGWTLTVQESTSTAGYRNTIATGNTPNGKALQITFNQGKNGVESGLSTPVVDAIISSIEFNPPESDSAQASTAAPTTVSEQNAIKKAKQYLDYTAFSYSGLIDQLKYEGFSTADATYAVDHCGADWNAQAVKKAKQYLDYTSFSRSRLIEQLEYEGFTAEQATYAVDQVGL